MTKNLKLPGIFRYSFVPFIVPCDFFLFAKPLWEQVGVIQVILTAWQRATVTLKQLTRHIVQAPDMTGVPVTESG